MDPLQSIQIHQIVATLVYAALGAVVFGVLFFVITKITPFSVKHEIETDQNVALAIIIGSLQIGLAIIIASAIH